MRGRVMERQPACGPIQRKRRRKELSNGMLGQCPSHKLKPYTQTQSMLGLSDAAQLISGAWAINACCTGQLAAFTSKYAASYR
eukprot:1203708-Amphidinium_carterae.1